MQTNRKLKSVHISPKNKSNKKIFSHKQYFLLIIIIITIITFSYLFYSSFQEFSFLKQQAPILHQMKLEFIEYFPEFNKSTNKLILKQFVTDYYYGEIYKNKKHGKGIYICGNQSKWKGDKYFGEWKEDK